MNKKLLYFDTSPILTTNNMFQKFNLIVISFLKKRNAQGLLALFFLFLSNFSYSQLALENFESGVPSTWAVLNSGGTTQWTATSTGYQSSNAVVINPALDNIGQGNTAEYFLITPQFQMPENGEIRFYTRQGSPVNRGTKYQIRVSTADQPDTDAFSIVIKEWTESELNTSATVYQEKVVPLTGIPTGLNVYVAFVAVNAQTGASASGDSWYVDNARILSGCDKVTGITSVIASESAIINWTHPTATNFGIEVVPQGAGHGNVGNIVDGFSYTASPLETNTTYDVYIKANCDATTSSDWAGPFKITTSKLGFGCETPIVIPTDDIATTPYVLSTNLNTFYNASNYTEYSSIGLSCQPPASNENYLVGDHAFLSFSPAESGLVNFSLETNSTGANATNQCYNNYASAFIFDNCAGVGTSDGCLGGLFSTPEAKFSELTNFYAEKGKTYTIVISSNLTQNAGICFTFQITAPSCPIPAGIDYENLTQTGANFSWGNPQNLVSSWEYVAIPTSSGAPVGTETLTTTNSNLSADNLVSGLLPGTAYNFYVRSLCDGVPGSWGKPFTFTTLCDALPTPYYTGFTNANEDSPEPCWTVLNLNGDTSQFSFGASAFDGPVAKLRTSEEGLNNDILVTPQFNFDGVTQKRLRFKYNIYGNWGLIVDNPTGGPGSFEVKLSTTGVGAENFTTTLVPLASYTTAYNYIEMDVVIPKDIVGAINIAWIVPPGAIQTGNWLYIDDVYVEDLPFCSEPKYPKLTPNSVTGTTAEISWINGYNTNQWEIITQPQYTGIPPASATGIIVDTNPYTLTNLIPSTRYEVWVRSYCDATHQSQWIGPVYFSTTCIAQDTPYYESFNEDDDTTKKFCWSVNNVQGDAALWTINESDASIAPLSPSFFEPFGTYDDYLISPALNASGAKQVRFKYRAAIQFPRFTTLRGALEVLVSTTDTNPESFKVIGPLFEFTNSSYEEVTFLFTGSNDGPIYIALRVPPTMENPASSGVIIIDDFVVEDATLCPKPKDLSASNLATTTATLSWKAGNAETKWEIAIQNIDSGIPTGSGTVVNTNPTYDATSLSSNTKYEYYVRAVCNETDNSEWVGPFLFDTTCDPFTTPFLETFDSNSTSESCWRIANNDSVGDFWSLSSTVQPMFGDQMAAIFTGNNGKNDDWLISPTITIKANQRVRFYYKTYSPYFTEDLKVKLSTNGIATDQFTTTLYENSAYTTISAGFATGATTVILTSNPGIRVGDFIDTQGINTEVYQDDIGAKVTAINGLTITFDKPAYGEGVSGQTISFTHELINNDKQKEMVINLPSGTVGNVNIALQIPFYPTRFIYKGQYIFVDNFIVEDIPACPSVFNVVTQNVTDTTAIVNWETSGSETSWQISVQPFGTTAPTGDTLPEYLYTADKHPFTITNLETATQYQYYVRSVCDGNTQGEWIGPFEFTTKCSFENLCKYTITLTNGGTGQVLNGIDVMQNGMVSQALEFPGFGVESIDYDVFLCTGVQFDLYWNGFFGITGDQYYEAQAVLKDDKGNVVWTSPLGLGPINTNLYTGVSTCGEVTCPQPRDLIVSNQGVLSWTPGGSETQWEVYVQPIENGTLPKSGIIVDNPSYTPTTADFVDATGATNEYFVRAICGASDTSFWSGPKEFVRNDEASTAVRLEVNSDENCVVSAENVSFIGATASTTPSSCGGLNGGDIWFDFIAESRVHLIELSNFAPGSYYASSFQGPWPNIIMSLFEVQSDGSLVEKSCSNNNTLLTIYSSELVVGETYKIRLALDDTATNDKKFNICITTPEACDMKAVNYDFERLPMQDVTGVTTIMTDIVVPGWRTNTETRQVFYQEGTNSVGISPYSGGQFLQLIQDYEVVWDPNNPKGLYKDFDTSEIIQMDYSYASATRGGASTVQLYAGPKEGPFVLINETSSLGTKWDFIKGKYMVPPGQNTTRFIFSVKEDAIGHLLDAANFVANTDIISKGATLDCATNTTVQVQAQGVGQWIADEKNPSATIIATPNATTTSISGFSGPGDYIFHWKTRYCDKTITYKYLGIDKAPEVVSPVIYCLNATASPLTATIAPEYTLLWYTVATGGIGSATAPTPSTAVVGNSQVYYVSALNDSGCEGPRAAIVVQVNDLPTATISGTATICKGATPVITFNGPSNATVNYKVNTVDASIVLDASGNATLTTPALTVDTLYELVNVVTSGTPSCSQAVTGSAIITMSTLPTTPDFAAIAPFCSGATAPILSPVSPNGITGVWSPATISNTQNGSYTFTPTDNACATTQTLNVVIIPEAMITFEEGCANNDYQLTAVIDNQSNATYQWTGPSFDTTEDANTIILKSAGTYSVKITTTDGCTSTETTTVNSIACLIQKGISPNNDGKNDFFDLSALNVSYLSIFNRYGKKVYDKSNYTNEWYGTTNDGKKLPDGTYYYVIERDGQESVTGWIYVIHQN